MIKLNKHLIEIFKFPNQETYADINKEWLNNNENNILLKFESNEDLISLQFICDFIKDIYPNTPLNLTLPYLPYSRMDRQEENRLFTLKSITNMINKMDFDSVTIMEPHSEISVALLDRVHVIDKSKDLALKAISNLLKIDSNATESKILEKARQSGIYLVYPDAGAKKRYKKQIKYDQIITCHKERDFNTGNITSIKLNNTSNLSNVKTAIIVDDLCSKGGTFLGVAQELKDKLQVNNIILVVTHTENTIYDGSVLSGSLIDKIYTTDSILTADRTNIDTNKIVIEEI